MDEYNLRDQVQRHFKLKYERENSVNSVVNLSQTTQQIDDEELLFSLVDVIQKQGEEITELKRRVDELQNPHYGV